MVVRSMELRHLRYFVAVAEEQNVTRAAARLRVSQPPLTRQIHDLEAELGVALFTRSGKRIRLTEAGRVFLEEVRASLQRVEEAVQAVRAVAAGADGELHLGYAPTPTLEILPRILKALHQHLPGVRVILHDHSSPEMLAGLREDRLHAALMMQPSNQAARGIQFEPLKSYAVGVAVTPAHPFARRRRVTVEQVCSEPIIVYCRKEYPDYQEFIGRSLGSQARKLRVAEECGSGTSLAAAVQSGKGICICASIFATATGRRLTFLPLHPRPPRAVVGIAHRSRGSDPLTGRLVEIARTTCRSAGES